MLKRSLMIVAVLIYINSYAQSRTDIAVDATFTHDVLGNVSGGLAQGVAVLDYGTLGITFNTENLGLWNGGELYINSAFTAGNEASAELIGDIQIVDNIEAGNHLYMQELWYKQQITDNISLTFGLQDYNADLMAREESGLYINSTFGTNNVIAYNVCPPIFPLSALGVRASIGITDNILLQLAAYDGEVYDFSQSNPFNLKWNISKEEGFLTAAEVGLSDKNSGIYKLGGYYHTALEKYGVYLLGEKRFERIALFGQIAWAPKKHNEIYSQIDGGINLYNLFCNDREDVMGLAFTSNLLNNMINSHETVVELTYKIPVYDRFYIQPDLQYVINPSGSGLNIDDAFVAMVRFGFEL
ncbi:MAG: carbohydrate porin [Bacteroidaceae bacterium]|nr:carbohydrate porin [Bacteroidaceae bacterium]